MVKKNKLSLQMATMLVWKKNVFHTTIGSLKKWSTKIRIRSQVVQGFSGWWVVVGSSYLFKFFRFRTLFQISQTLFLQISHILYFFWDFANNFFQISQKLSFRFRRHFLSDFEDTFFISFSQTLFSDFVFFSFCLLTLCHTKRDWGNEIWVAAKSEKKYLQNLKESVCEIWKCLRNLKVSAKSETKRLRNLKQSVCEIWKKVYNDCESWKKVSKSERKLSAKSEKKCMRNLKENVCENWETNYVDVKYILFTLYIIQKKTCPKQKTTSKIKKMKTKIEDFASDRL